MSRFPGAIRAFASVLLLLCLALPLGADVTYYHMTFDQLRPVAGGFEERGKRYPFRRDGGGAALATRRDARIGSTVLVLKTDPTPPGADRDRAEVQIHSGISWRRDWVASLRFRIPDHTSVVADWQTLMQCPQVGNDLPPPISVDLEPDGRISLVVRSERDVHEIIWSAPLPRGRWSTLALGFRMGADGRARLWLDGRKMVDVRLPLGWVEAEELCVLKTGIYRAPSPNPFELHLDDVTLGDSYTGTRLPK
ncbi:polysaccharide lyase [Rhodobacteraceae bacterium D3-12]|nr:polysaccharide lyase [Rhodobacteraceae bacterium D3-12]